MEYRVIGNSGLRASVLSFGTFLTFGGGKEYQYAGKSEIAAARRIIAQGIDHGINLFDTADVYSEGAAEEILGAAIKEKRKQVLISTKASFRTGAGENDIGNSRYHLIDACEASLRRLGTDYIDIYHLHGFDTFTPLEETLQALEQLIRQGKVRYIACSNFSGWHLSKAMLLACYEGYQPFIAQQIYYSLLARESEYELIPAGLDLKIGTLVWSPLSSGLLSGKFHRNAPKPEVTRLASLEAPGTVNWEHLYAIVDELTTIATNRNKSVPQVALNWLLQRPTVSSVILGVRNDGQLEDNLGAIDWSLTDDEMAALDKVSQLPEIYPYWHQHKWGLERNPKPL